MSEFYTADLDTLISNTSICLEDYRADMELTRIETLERIRASLRASRYENGKLVSDQGGDIVVMNEVDRIVLEAIRYWTK
jgi:HJR/Mrr/RecB family endonuclease